MYRDICISYRDIHTLEQEYGQGWTFQVVLVVKNLPANAGDTRDVGSIPGLTRFPGPTPVFFSEESHGQRRLVIYSFRVAKSQTQLKPLSTHAYQGCSLMYCLVCNGKKQKKTLIVHHQMVPIYEKYHVAAKQNEVKLCIIIQKDVYHILSLKKSKL